MGSEYYHTISFETPKVIIDADQYFKQMVELDRLKMEVNYYKSLVKVKKLKIKIGGRGIV